MSIDGTASITFNFNDRRTVGINASGNLPINLNQSNAYTNGTAANQVQVLYQSSRTFSGSSDVLNLTTGLTDSYGTGVALTAGKAVFFYNTSTSNTITIGAGSNPITTLLNSTGTLTLNPGAFVLLSDPTASGWAITSSTACNFNVSGTSGQSYQFGVVGLGT